MYQIKQLEALSGIKAHTIRIWEQRYDLLNPRRTDTNIRYYSDDDLRRLLNIATLSKHGYKISKISAMSDREIRATIHKLYEAELHTPDELSAAMDGLVSAMVGLDEIQFELIYHNAYQSMSFDALMERLIYPFLTKVGLMWGTEDIYPSQEHFISNLLRQKLISEINALPISTTPKETWILFLNEGELHEIGLLYAQYLLKLNDYRVIYLGANVPYRDLKSVIELSKPHSFFTINTTPQEIDITEQFFTILAEDFPENNVYFSQANDNLPTNIPENCHFLKDIPSLKALLQ